MQKYFYLLIVTFTMLCCQPKPYIGQQSHRNIYKNKFSHHLQEGEVAKNEGYNYVHSVNAEGHYIIRYFHPEKDQLVKMSVNKNGTGAVRNGLTTRWYDNGNKRDEGVHINDKKSGLWSSYSFESNSLRYETNYVDGKPHGLKKKYDAKARIISSFSYLNGKKNGAFVTYDSLANVTNEGIYKDNEIVSQSKTENDNSKQNNIFRAVMKSCKNLSGEARSECTNQTMLKTIYKNIRYPVVARENGVQGTVVISFMIETDGAMTEFKVLNGICQQMEDECLRVVKENLKWTPATKDGQPIRKKFTLPIKFKLA